MNALLHHESALLELIYKFVQNEAWSLVSTQFYKIHARRATKFAFASIENVHNFALQRLLNSTTYAKRLKKLSIENTTITVILDLFNKFAQQLHFLKLNHKDTTALLEELGKISTIAFPKLKHLDWMCWYDSNAMFDTLQWFLERASNLQVLVLRMKIPQMGASFDHDAMQKMAPLVKHVPQVQVFAAKQQVDSLRFFAASQVHGIRSKAQNNKWHEYIAPFFNLLVLHLDFYPQVPQDASKAFGSLTKLKSVTFTKLSISNEAVQNEFFGCVPSSLESFTLDSVSLFTFPLVQHLHKLSKLELKTVRLITCKHIPEWMQSMSELKTMILKLSARATPEASPSFSHFPKNLETLHVYHCNITSQLPASITELHCDQTVPDLDVLQTLPKLKQLHFRKTGFVLNEPFPYQSMQHLTEFCLKDFVPSDWNGILQWQQLTNVVLCNSADLVDVPHQLALLSHLTMLDLSHNKISNLDCNLFDEDKGHFQALQVLQMKNNPFTKYPAFINLSKLNSVLLPTISNTDTNSELVYPAQVNRQEWTTFAIQHFKKAREYNHDMEESLKIVETILLAAIPCKQNIMYLFCRVRGKQQFADMVQLFGMRVLVPSMTCECVFHCKHLES